MSYSHLQRCLYKPGCIRPQYTTARLQNGDYIPICRFCFPEFKRDQTESRALIGSGFEKT